LESDERALTAFPQGESFTNSLSSKLKRTPRSEALVYEQQSLSYEQLNRRANQVAHYLRQRGSGPETLVGICLERSLEMVIGILGDTQSGRGGMSAGPSVAHAAASVLAHRYADLPSHYFASVVGGLARVPLPGTLPGSGLVDTKCVA